jgi:hypothetical protein
MLDEFEFLHKVLSKNGWIGKLTGLEEGSDRLSGITYKKSGHEAACMEKPVAFNQSQGAAVAGLL